MAHREWPHCSSDIQDRIWIGALECSEAEHAVCDTFGDSTPSVDSFADPPCRRVTYKSVHGNRLYYHVRISK